MAAELDIHRAKTMLDDKAAVFLDMRDPGSYSQAHIPGATFLSDGTIGDVVANTEKDQALVVYCYHGNSSRSGAAYFENLGFKTVYSMSGGFEAWRGVYPQESS